LSDQRKDQWIEQYEEAALGLLMEEYADAEGARLLQEYEEASQQGTMEPMPEELTNKCLKIIDQVYAKRHNRKLFSGITKTVGKVAVYALIVFGIISATVLSVDAWRIPVLNFILDESGNHASINFENSDNSTADKFEEIKREVSLCIPFGYELINQPSVEGAILNMRFCNAEGNRILITVRLSDSELVVDTEKAEYTELEINGHRALLIQKESLYIIWHDETERMAYEIYADGLSADEFWELVYSMAE